METEKNVKHVAPYGQLTHCLPDNIDKHANLILKNFLNSFPNNRSSFD